MRFFYTCFPFKIRSGQKTGHMLNRKAGRSNQEICHKVKNGQFECGEKKANVSILAIAIKLEPSLLIGFDGELI